MAATAQVRTPHTIRAADLRYETFFDPALRLWVAQATGPKALMKALGASRAQALEILWRHVRETVSGASD